MNREVYKLNAEGKTPGRLATEISVLLQGKNKPDWAPHNDTGGFVEVENADKIKITGNKLKDYKYYNHSGYPGGLRTRAMKELTQEEVIPHAVYKMLPKNRLRDPRIKRLKFV